MEYMRRQDYTNAMVWFNKAIGFNPKHGYSHFQIATIEFRQGKTEEAAARANRILSTMSPNWGLSAEIQKLLEEIQVVMSKSYWDEYHRLVAVAEREWKAGRSVQALQALRTAADYQSENNIFVTDNEKVLVLADRIMKGMTTEAEQDVRAGRYELAITKYENLIAFFSTHAPELVNMEPLDRRIGEILEMNQNELLLQGRRLLNEKSYARAFETLNQCLETGNKYNLNQPSELQRLLDEARGGVFSGMLFSGQQAMNNRDLQSAEFYLREAINFLGGASNNSNNPALDAYKVNFMNAYLAEGQKWLASKNFDRAIEWFDKAQQAQYSYGIPGNFNIQSMKLDAHDGIALEMMNNTENLLNRKSYPQALAGLKEVYQYVQDHGLAGQSKAKMITVADQYYRDVLQRIDVANRAKGYTNALEMIGEARYLCDHFQLRCDPSVIDQRERDSRQSIFNLLVSDADKALSRGDLGQAQGLMKDADKYQKEHTGFVSPTRESGQVAGKVRQRSYQQSVTTGKSLLDRKEYKQALSHFDEAFLMEQEGGFTTDKKLRDYRTTAALHTLLLEADNLEQMLGQANYMATKDKMTQIMTMRTRYNLQDNKTLDQRLKSLQGRMVSAACLQQQRTYDEEMEKGRKMELEVQYIAAGEAYRRAAEAARRHPECDLTDTLASAHLLRITPAIKYQEKMAEADKLLKAYKNTEAFAAYAQAENLYNTHNLSQIGLNHEPASDYALKQNLNFILAAAFYYKEKGETASVMKMLEALSNKGYPPSQTRLLQEQIGFQLGKQDRQKYTGSTWKVAVLQHTSGKKFYKYFRSAYKKGWKSK
jgi:tetratricopeptide (TPR) repeat protein